MKVWALLVFLVLGAVSLSAKVPLTEISVNVTGKNDKPVERAAVILDFLTSHRQVFKLGRREPKHWEIRTNMQGVAHFPSIPQGTIRIQVIANGYQTYGQKYDVDDPQKTIDIKMSPPQKQYTVYPASDTSKTQ